MAGVLSAAEFGGYPFLDGGFARDRVLVAVACARWYRLKPEGRPTAEDLRGMLVPERAVTIQQLDLLQPLESTELSPDQELRVASALGTIGSAVPRWRPLLEVPWRYRRLVDDRGAIGASSYAWPQHVFLSEAAFASDHELSEQLVHELCHGWLYLLEQLSPLQHQGCTRQITLPSGTSERGVGELLGALHVVASLRRLWSSMDAAADLRARRLQDLDEYLRGALDLLPEAEPCLTPEGASLADRLREEAA